MTASRSQDAEFERVLTDLCNLSVSEYEKGQRFERLTLAFLRIPPQWATKFSNVWLWEDWPGNQGEVDTGVDLIAEHSDGSGYTAVQCKFYDPSTSLTLEHLGTFFARSGTAPFTERMIVATTGHWSSHLDNAIAKQTVPVIKVGPDALANSGVDWSEWRADRSDQLRRATREPRPHQRRAIDDVLAGFEGHNRGKLIMACGTGKTFTGRSSPSARSAREGASWSYSPRSACSRRP